MEPMETHEPGLALIAECRAVFPSLGAISYVLLLVLTFSLPSSTQPQSE